MFFWNNGDCVCYKIKINCMKGKESEWERELIVCVLCVVKYKKVKLEIRIWMLMKLGLIIKNIF